MVKRIISTIYSLLRQGWQWLVFIWRLFVALFIKTSTHNRQFRRKTVEELKPTNHFYHRAKPDWVVNNIIQLNAVMPDASCRNLAHTFNRSYEHHAKTPMTVGKTWVCETIKKHYYEIQVTRKNIKNRKLKATPKNITWAMDLTTVTDHHKKQHYVFSIVDHGTRACLCLAKVDNKSSLVLLHQVLNCIKIYGRPKRIRTDNEMVFCSWLFDKTLAMLNIKHQSIDKGCPWQNGRVERFFGTFKERINKLFVENAEQLSLALPQFRFWYNHIRVHHHLNGRTPAEAWSKTLYNPKKQPLFFDAWDGLLTGYYFPV